MKSTGSWRLAMLKAIAGLLLLANLYVQAAAQQMPVPQTPATQVPVQGEPVKAGAIAGETGPESALVSEAVQLIETWNRSLDTMLQAIGRDGVADGELAGFASETASIQGEAAKTIEKIGPVVTRLGEQASELGEAPVEESSTESADLTARRTALNDRLSRVDSLLKEARLVLVKAQQVESAALSKRRERFVESLTTRSRSILDPVLWQEATIGTKGFVRSLRIVVSDSVTAAIARIGAEPLKALILLAELLVAALVYIFLRNRLLSRTSLPLTGVETQTGQAEHLFDFLRTGLLPAAMVVLFGKLAADSGLLSGRLITLILFAIASLAVFLLALSLLRIFLRPLRPRKRIAPLSDNVAKKIFSTGVAGLSTIAVMRFLNLAALNLLAPFELSIVLSAVMALAAIAAGARILVLSGKARSSPSQVTDGSSRLIQWRHLRPVLWLGIAVSALGLVGGYIALAEFVAYQAIVVLTVYALTRLIFGFIDQVKGRVLDSETGNLTRLHDATGVSDGKLRQLTVLSSGFLRLLVFIVAVAGLLLPWGVRTQEWAAFVDRFFFGFQVGGITVSFSAILFGILVFSVAIILTRGAQKWIASQLLPTTSLDSGMRNSLATVFGYAGYVLAALVAIGAAGLDLSNLAIVAGALSVGIGFGLQSIVNNFVSGLILLAERPIKAGDWVVTGGGEGTVRRISVRSTEIETFDNATIILPNSTLITDPVLNWTHRSTVGRFSISIGVGYDSDPERVRDILMGCVTAHEETLKRPEPQVIFSDFGADALVFDVRAWLADIGRGMAVKSDLRYAILAALRREGIEIPFPQRDIHIKSGLALPELQTTKRPAGRTREKKT
ncbi:MAG: DUF3772 domain-containing protein [Rhizobiaceae bacterium]